MSVTITMARAKAFALWPYLAMPLSRLALIAKPGMGTMAVSDKWQLFYDPAALERWGLEASAAVVAHEVWHLVRRHHLRRGDRDPAMWNVACDIAINDDGSLARALPVDGVRWSQFLGVSENMLEEDIYDVLVKEQAQQAKRDARAQRDSGSDGPSGSGGSSPPPSPGTGSEPGDAAGSAPAPKAPPVKDYNGKEHGKDVGDGACGSGAGGVPGPWENDPDDPIGGGGETSETDAVLVERAVAEAVQSCGSASMGAKRWANVVTAPPVVPWQQVLRVALGRAVRMVPGATDYSYARSRLRSGVLTPRLRKPACPVAIVLDTSGSVSGPLLDAALTEVDGILKALRVPCTVLACDTQVHGGAQKVTSASMVKALGGGGTNMGAGIKAADELTPRHGAVVVLTDGYTPWPSDPPRGPCIVALIGSGDNVASRIPAWATVVRVS